MQKRRMHEKSKLLELLHNREKDIARMPEQYEVPEWARVMKPKTLQTLQEAVRCVQEVDNSDPWSGKRMELLLFRGIELPSDILKSCAFLRGAKRKQFEAPMDLTPIKRKMDEDKAWNQFHSAQYQEENAA